MLATTTEDLIDLSTMARSIRGSSNFRFAWQFYRVDRPHSNSPHFIQHLLKHIILDPILHEFLRTTFDDMYCSTFKIEELHEHCSIEESTNQFLDTMARAENHRLGAYSRDLHSSTARERERITQVFGELGAFTAFDITPGKQDGCEICKQYNHHLFTNWFFDVAWDFTYFVTWPKRDIVWMGCLTDTD